MRKKEGGVHRAGCAALGTQPPHIRPPLCRPRKRHYTDKDVCRYYMTGFCPYEEFRRTKNDCGDCPSIHDEECKAQYEAADDRTKERLGYEAELLRWMEKLLVDLRKRIDSNTVRLRAVDNPLLLHEDQAKLDAMTAQMKELVARAERMGEEGEIDGAMEATNDAERLKVRWQGALGGVRWGSQCGSSLSQGHGLRWVTVERLGQWQR